MNTEQERTAFEAWYRHHHGSLDVYALDESGEYVDKQVQGAFNVWQARAALQSQDDWISPTSLTGLEKDELIRQLQWALDYWMPPIAGEGTPDGERASKEAYLLLGMRTPVGRENENTPSYWEKREALQSQTAGGYPCKIVEADFEAGTVTLQMDGQFTVSAGQKYLCDYALQSQDREDALRYRRPSWAGVTVWVGDRQKTHAITKHEFEHCKIDVLQAAFDHARRIEGEGE